MKLPLDSQLTTLETSGLIRAATVEPDLEYLFRHGLIQDAAYGSLLKTDRRALHRTVGEALEQLYPERADDLAPLLAQHFAEARDDQRALHYFALAGDAAARVYANAEASMHYARAIEIAKREILSQSPDHREASHREPVTSSPNLSLSNLYLRRGRALELNAQYDHALANYIEMETVARERGDRAQQLAALMQRVTLHSTSTPKFDFALAEQLSTQCLELAQALNDPIAEARILWNRMNLYRFSGHMRQSLEYGEQALALARANGEREQLAFILNDMTHIYVGSNQPDYWRVSLAEATALWRELDNRPMLADSLGTASLYNTMTGRYADAIAASGEALTLSRAINNSWGQSYSLSFVGRAYWDQGDIGRAITVMEEAVRLGEVSGFVVAQTQTRADLAAVYGSLGAIEIGLEHAQQAAVTAERRIPVFHTYALAIAATLHLWNGHFDLAAENLALAEQRSRSLPHPLSMMALAHSQARLALAQGHYTKVLELSDGALKTLRTIGFMPFIPEALYLKGLALLKSHQPAEGQLALHAARAEAEALGARWTLWPILVALAELEAERGHLAEAAALRAQAQDHLYYIADHCPPALRESFLNLPNVRQVTNERVA